MKMRKPSSSEFPIAVLKNAKFWNGKSFELRDEVRLTSGQEGKAVEYDCKGALVIPALFGFGLDFMETAPR